MEASPRSATCAVEEAWICDVPGQACRQPVCGDSRQDGWWVAGTGGSGAGGTGTGGTGSTYYWEECDDGNAASGDGCTSSCTIESGWVCTGGAGVACRRPSCGDGYVDYIAGVGGGGSIGGGSSGGGPGYGSYEACDDGNLTSGDGCDTSCSVEPGFSCWFGACHPIVCGDGLRDYPDEQCDDGNTIPNDGCTACVWDYPGGGGAGGAFPGGGAMPTAGSAGFGTGGSGGYGGGM